jgi:histone deacetylase 1/2
MYGTRKAGDGWHVEISATLTEKLGFTKGDASACIFRHTERSIECSIHGDDLPAQGPKEEPDWYRQELEKTYELKEGARLGPGAKDDKESRMLNRVIRWTPEGIEYEADPRQTEQLVSDVSVSGSKSVGTPGVKPTSEQIAADQELSVERQRPYRGVAARSNYLSADRPDMQHAAKEVCRWMSTPTEVALVALKRVGRYLEGHSRLVYKYVFQEASKIDCYSDTDWAGCPRTRRSTSGGCLMLGKHLIKSWSTTQGPISLSSGEAEFYGVVKASSVALGYQAMMEDLGQAMEVRVWTDSTATMGICEDAASASCAT